MSVCGTVSVDISVEAFSCHRDSCVLRLAVAQLGFTAYLRARIYLRPSQARSLAPGQPSPGHASPHASPHRSRQRYGNMNPFPIGYAFRPRLRGRLTLGRRTLPRKPSAFGGGGSHPSFRYSCLHSHFRYLQGASRLPLLRHPERSPTTGGKPPIRGFGTMLELRCIVGARLLDQ